MDERVFPLWRNYLANVHGTRGENPTWAKALAGTQVDSPPNRAETKHHEGGVGTQGEHTRLGVPRSAGPPRQAARSRVAELPLLILASHLCPRDGNSDVVTAG